MGIGDTGVQRLDIVDTEALLFVRDKNLNYVHNIVISLNNNT